MHNETKKVLIKLLYQSEKGATREELVNSIKTLCDDETIKQVKGKIKRDELSCQIDKIKGFLGSKLDEILNNG